MTTVGETPVFSASAEPASPTTLGTCYTSVLVAFRPR